jgi:hypothetical protein
VSAFCVFRAGFTLDFVSDPEDGGDMFLRNVGLLNSKFLKPILEFVQQLTGLHNFPLHFDICETELLNFGHA